jgi:SnoaL-like domain
MSITEQNAFITSSDELVSDADYLQLSRLVTEHVWRVDNGHADTVFELYTEDAELALVGPEPLRGRGAIREWGRQIVSNPPWNTIRHVVSDMHFVYDGPDAARGTHVVTAFMDADGTRSSVPWNLGEDHDRFVRTEDGWRIASRSFESLFERGDTINIP